MVRNSECWTLPVDRRIPWSEREARDLRVEPLPRLEWSLATESDPPLDDASPESMSPSSIRRGWVHRAAEDRVLTLFRKLNAMGGQLPAPWWLKALDRGELASRATAFVFEDDVHALLTSRPGWVFVPWGTAGEAGYWEYGPSDRKPMSVPSTVTMTDRHRGWVNVAPAHTDPSTVLPVPLDGVSGLAASVARIESW